MSALEQEVIAKFRLLDKEAQQRVRTLIDQETEAAEFDFEAWMHGLEEIWADMRRHQSGHSPKESAIDILRAIRNGEDEG